MKEDELLHKVGEAAQQFKDAVETMLPEGSHVYIGFGYQNGSSWGIGHASSQKISSIEANGILEQLKLDGYNLLG